MDFAFWADDRVKLQESEKRDKYQDFGKELKKNCDMKVTVTPIVIDALGKSPKDWYRDWMTWK